MQNGGMLSQACNQCRNEYAVQRSPHMVRAIEYITTNSARYNIVLIIKVVIIK